MIENILDENDNILSIIIYSDHTGKKINFVTPIEFTEQLAIMYHEKGTIITPHKHNKIKREVFYTQEVLFIRKGRLKVNFYSESGEYKESRILNTGDVILLASGGHGFEVIEDVEMFEVKQGPYLGDSDKTKFTDKIFKKGDN